jgi:hypothetical protein
VSATQSQEAVSSPGGNPARSQDNESPAAHIAATLLVAAMGRVAKYASLVVVEEVRAARAASGRIVQFLAGAAVLLATAWFILNAAAIWIGIAHFGMDATVMLLAVGGLNLFLAIVLGLVALRNWRLIVNTPNRVALKVFGGR